MSLDFLREVVPIVGTLVGVWFGFFLQSEFTKAQNNKNQELSKLKQAIDEIEQRMLDSLAEQDTNLRAALKVAGLAINHSTANSVGTTSYGGVLSRTLDNFAESQIGLQRWFAYAESNLARKFGENKNAIASRLQGIGEEFDNFYESLYIATSDMEFLAQANLAGHESEVEQRRQGFYESVERLTTNKREFASEVRKYSGSLENLIPIEITASSRMKVAWNRLNKGETPSSTSRRGGVLVQMAHRLEWVLGRRDEEQ